MSFKKITSKHLTINKVLFLSVIGGIFLFSFSNCRKEPTPAASSATDTTGNAATNPPTGGGSGGNGSVATSGNTLKSMFGINAFEWNFLNPTNQSTINEANMTLIKSFSAFRHYLDWRWLEDTQGSYTFNPTNQGGWNYDIIYTRCKQEGILVLADLKSTSRWLEATWPLAQQNDTDLPIVYGTSRSDPASYIAHGQVGFQFAARYGYNTAVDKSLVTVGPSNQVQIGMSVIKYIECNNEEDRWWAGIQSQQSAEEYAADLSAFYDGNMGKLGKNVGVKTADPNMVVVMGGMSTTDPVYVTKMVAWCKANRGLRADGSVNLCFDVINYHYYNSLNNMGVAPELSPAGTIADSFVSVAKGISPTMQVWVTESGYDINSTSTQKAPAIGNKSALVTQADWILRTCFLYMRHNISQLFFYELFDDSTPDNGTIYETSGLVNATSRRPAADYILQTTKLMGGYSYVKTLSTDPLVDQYQSGTKTMYVLMIPDQKGRTGTYTLTTASNTPLNLYNLKVGADAVTSAPVTPVANKLTINVSETPVFVGN